MTGGAGLITSPAIDYIATECLIPLRLTPLDANRSTLAIVSLLRRSTSIQESSSREQEFFLPRVFKENVARETKGRQREKVNDHLTRVALWNNNV